MAGNSEETPRVIGVDGCKNGWIGIASDLRAYFGATIDQLVSEGDADGELSVIAIDIPIGLPVSGSRQADVLARRVVGKRSSSVFPTPIREALFAESHAKASAISLRVAGKGLSQQAFALGKKILEVDGWVLSSGRSVIEVHPEVSFATMAKHSLEYPKSSWPGIEERRQMLASVGIEVPADLGPAATMAKIDDVLDAAAACWTAARYAEGIAESLPTPGEDFGDGHLAAIWA